MPIIHEEITEKILAACFEVSNELGAGFVESVYQNALMIALQEKGLNAKREHPLTVIFRNQNVGQFYADFLVEDKIILELKAVSALAEIHKAQLLNYLKTTGLKTGLLINFGNPKLEYRRFDNRFINKAPV